MAGNLKKDKEVLKRSRAVAGGTLMVVIVHIIVTLGLLAYRLYPSLLTSCWKLQNLVSYIFLERI